MKEKEASLLLLKISTENKNNENVVQILKQNGVLNNLQETDQLSLF